MNKILDLINKHFTVNNKAWEATIFSNIKREIEDYGYMLNKEPKIKLRWYTYVERLHGTTVKTSSSVTFVEKL